MYIICALYIYQKLMICSKRNCCTEVSEASREVPTNTAVRVGWTY
jgi:hypothetical protein